MISCSNASIAVIINCCLLDILLFSVLIYSQISITRTSLGPWKFVQDMGSSSQCELIMKPGQEANGDNLGNF